MNFRLMCCAAPVVAFFAAFWLLPVVQLLRLPAQKGWATYFAVLTDSRYLHSLLNTLGLSLVVTLATLGLGAAVGITLARQRFQGRKLLLSLLTLPLSFPGVIVGFFIILLGGRQGLVADVTEWAGLGRSTFAYGLSSLFLAYLYFSLPRAIAAYTAAAAAMDAQLEEAARTVGASFWQRFLGVLVPAALPAIVAGTLMVFTLSVGEFNLTWMLHTPLTRTLPVGLADSYASMRIEIGSAYTLVFLLVILPVLWGLQVLGTLIEKHHGT